MAVSAKRLPVFVSARELARWLLVATALVAACGSTAKPQAPPPGYSELISPGTRPPASDVERKVLGQLKDIAPGAEITVAGHVVVAGVPYHSASGRQCRTVTIAATATDTRTRARLACLVDNAWAFVTAAVSDWEPPEP